MRASECSQLWQVSASLGLGLEALRVTHALLTCHSCEHWDALTALEQEQPATRRLWKVGQ